MEGGRWSWKRQIESAQIKLARQKARDMRTFQAQRSTTNKLAPAFTPRYSPQQRLLPMATAAARSDGFSTGCLRLLCLLWRKARRKLVGDFSTKRNVIKSLQTHTQWANIFSISSQKNFKSVLRVEYVLFLLGFLSKRFSSRYELRVYLTAHLSYLSPNQIVHFFKTSLL